MKRILFPLFLICLCISACSKPKDQETPEVDLTRRYCNDPYAVNYNDSFPGIADNDRCRYAYDIFKGNWELTDSIFRADDSYFESTIKTISFIPIISTEKNTMHISGWCSSDILLSANKYAKAIVVNQLPYPDSAQIACGNDTLMGYFQISIINTDSMNIIINNRSNAGMETYHKSFAIRKD